MATKKSGKRASPVKSGKRAGGKGRSLVIVESPAKAKTINKILGPAFVVKACMGHVRDLPERALGIDVDHGFEPTYQTVRGKGKVLTELRASTKAADTVYLAPDPDREGEAIAWHLVQALRIPEAKARRVTFNEITKRGVLDAFDHPGTISMALVNAQQARRVLDRIVGYKLSPLLWKKVGRGLSAGRVQSVAVRLIVEREREIRAFKPVEYWTIAARLSKKDRDQPFHADLVKVDDKEAEIADGQIARGLVEEFQRAEWRVESVTKKEKQDPPPAPFTTSTLQQQSANRLYFSAVRTMRIAQQLYEGIELGEEGSVGLITYMRTDSYRVSDEAASEAREFIAKSFGDAYVPERPPAAKKAGKLAQEAHEAIRPTFARRTPDELKPFLTPEQYKLYRLIWRRFVASQMRPAEYLLTDARIRVGRGLFAAKGRELKFDGYTRLLSPWIRAEEIRAMEQEGLTPEAILQKIKAAGLRPAPEALAEVRRLGAGIEDKTILDALTKSKDQILPPLDENEPLDLRELLPEQHFTEPPPRYNEASLVKALEKFGIGRPSTYAPIIQTIQDRGYVHPMDRKLIPTELGEIVTDKLVEHFEDIMNTGFTADMEQKLDLIEEGKREWVEVLHEFYDVFVGDLEKAREAMESVKATEPEQPVPCVKCGKPMLIKWNRFGKFLACSGYPECKSTKPLQAPEVAGENCDRCGAPMIIKSGRFGRFLACSKYPECRATRPLPRGNKRLKVPEGFSETCEACGSPMAVRYGRRGPFIACTGYPHCKNTRRVPKEWFVDVKSAASASAPPAESPPEDAEDESERDGAAE
ncbi:MAG: type I DNA topoisomerase [Planctomycetes bacterium]|nr:type I DNA topoisomerase [Planctomycetota bacterium]